MKRKLCLFIASIFFLFTVPVFSQVVDKIEQDDNNGEVMSLLEIERLIRQTDYTEALKQLTIYIEKKPEYFDNAQRLIKTIMNRRQQYSVLAERAIKSSTENPEDHETPAKIILQMRSIEKNPPAEIKHMIDMLEEMHLFQYYAYLFDKIQNESAELSEKGNYFEAISAVTSEGFDIYKDEFYSLYENDNPEMITAAENIVLEVNSLIAQYEDNVFQREFDNITSQFIKAVNADDYRGAVSLLPQLKTVYSRYCDLRNKMLECSFQINELYLSDKTDESEFSDASYLPFMQRFVSGVTSRENSGILGAIDCKYNDSVENMKSAVEKVFKNYSNNYVSDLPKDILVTNLSERFLQSNNVYMTSLTNYDSLGKEVNALYALLNKKSEGDNVLHPEYDISLDYELNLASVTNELLQKAISFNQEKEIQNQLLAKNKNNPSESNDELVKSLLDSVFRMSDILGIKNDLLPSAFEWGKAYNQLQGNESIYVMDWQKHTKTYNGYLDNLFSTSDVAIIDSWKSISNNFKLDSDDYLAEIQKYNQTTSLYTKGFDNHIETADYSRIDNNPAALYAYSQTIEQQKNPVYFYPNFTQQLFEYTENIGQSYISDLTDKQNTLTENLNEHVDWYENKELNGIVTDAVTYLENQKQKILNIVTQSRRLSEQNQNLLDNALYAKNNGDSIFEESLEAYNNGQLDKAEKLLLEASDKYTESLAIFDDYKLQQEVDNKRIDLSTKIMDAKNEIVIRESRELYTQAREAQNYDRYDDAETYINAAINKWAETHVEKNPEFEDFRELVNTAISMKTGRDLLPSDPLFSEMSQLLSIANQYYEQGEELAKQKKNEESNNALNLAVESLNTIKTVYPLNQDASLLLLKIDRLRDPDKFEQEFDQKIQSALAMSRQRDTQTQGYNNLVDYYNLAPDYKGLKDAIYNLEIELGMRQKPVDNSAVTRSSRLTADAQAIFNRAGNDTVKLNSALDTINEALRINPNNKTAETLKDKISAKLGSSSIIVMTVDEQNLLTQAKKSYQNGNVDEANVYMLRLLNNNPNNIKVKEVEDLYNKIQSQL